MPRLRVACATGLLVVLGGPGCTSSSSTAGAPDASHDAVVAVEANPAACPTLKTILELGTPCGWVGTCTVDLDLCGTGGVSTASVCTAGLIALPGGASPTCVSDAAPPKCIPDTACTGSGQCQVASCGAGLMCSCVRGAWYCPDAFCTDAGVCARGASCGHEGSVCTSFGAGPCGTDQRFVCGPSGTYAADAFLCTSPSVTCELPAPDAGGCGQRCTCSDDVLTCAPTCDGG